MLSLIDSDCKMTTLSMCYQEKAYQLTMALTLHNIKLLHQQILQLISLALLQGSNLSSFTFDGCASYL
jgi:hypothetical protein